MTMLEAEAPAIPVRRTRINHLLKGGGIAAVAGRTPSFDWSLLTGRRSRHGGRGEPP